MPDIKMNTEKNTSPLNRGIPAFAAKNEITANIKAITITATSLFFFFAPISLFIPLMINPPVFSYINFINFINGYLIVTDDTAPFLKETDILNIPTLYTIFPVLELSL